MFAPNQLLHFTKTVYPDYETHKRYTCKKTANNKQVIQKTEAPIIIEILKRMIEETGEVTGIASILTMVAYK